MSSKILVKRIGLSAYQTESSILREKELFEKIGCRYEAVSFQKKTKDKSYFQELGGLGQDAEVILISTSVSVCKKVLNDWKSLKFLIISSSGFDHVDLESLWDRGIRVARLAEARKRAVAEHTLSFLLSMLRMISAYERPLKQSHIWNRQAVPGLGLIHQKTLGIIGYGAIGEEVAHLWKALGGKPRIYDPKFQGTQAAQSTPPKDLFIEQDLKTLLKKCDLLTLHCNLTEKTRRLVDENFLKDLKPNAALVNTARGELIDPKALLKSLKNQKLSGIALDVFGIEPPFEDQNWAQILEHPKVQATPHVAGLHDDLVSDISHLAVEKVKAWSEEKPIDYEIKAPTHKP